MFCLDLMFFAPKSDVPTAVLSSLLQENACLKGANAAVDMGCRRKDDTPALLSLDDGLERRSSSPKTLFIKPIGNLLERLQAIASAATVAKSEGTELVVVWKKDGDEEFPASWEDLYRSKENDKHVWITILWMEHIGVKF